MGELFNKRVLIALHCFLRAKRVSCVSIAYNNPVRQDSKSSPYYHGVSRSREKGSERFEPGLSRVTHAPFKERSATAVSSERSKADCHPVNTVFFTL